MGYLHTCRLGKAGGGNRVVFCGVRVLRHGLRRAEGAGDPEPVEFNIPVAIFSLEMSSVQLVQRLIASETEIDSEKLRKGNLQDHEFHQLQRSN